MSFEVFRRHQRKLLAIFAILAMFGFVVSDSLPRLLSPSARRPRPAGRHALRQDGLPERPQRDGRGAEPAPTGSSPQSDPLLSARTRSAALKTRDLVDALILQHEADRLGIPAGPEVGREFLKQITQGRMTRELFEALLGRLQQPGQRRAAPGRHRQPGPAAAKVRRLLGCRVVTPYDVFRAYRDQNERVAAKLVEVPVEKFLAKVPEPSPEEIQAVLRKVQGRSSRPVARPPDSRSLARSRSRSSRSTATPWPGASRTSSPRRSCGPRTRTASRNSRSSPSRRTAQRPLRRPARADPADHQAVRRGPHDPGRRAGRGEGPGRDRREVRQDQG